MRQRGVGVGGGGAGEKRLYDKYLYYLQARLNLHSLEVYSNLKIRKHY